MPNCPFGPFGEFGIMSCLGVWLSLCLSVYLSACSYKGRYSLPSTPRIVPPLHSSVTCSFAIRAYFAKPTNTNTTQSGTQAQQIEVLLLNTSVYLFWRSRPVVASRPFFFLRPFFVCFVCFVCASKNWFSSYCFRVVKACEQTKQIPIEGGWESCRMDERRRKQMKAV